MARTNFPLISVALSGVAIRYSGINRDQRGYIADRVAPYRNVTSQLFRWYSSKLSEAFRVYDTQIDRLGQANEMTHGWTLTEDSTKDYAIREPVPYADEAEANAQAIPFSLRQEAAQNVVDQIQLNREVRVSTFVNSTSSYLTGYYVDKASAKWSDFANSDPIADVKDAISKMLIRPTVAVTSRRVADILQRHPKVAVALGGSQSSGMYYPLDQIARLMGLREIIVGDTLYQTSKPGQTLVTGNIWADNFALHYQGGTTDGGTMSLAGAMTRSPDFLTTFRWAPGGQEWVATEKTFEPGDMGLRGGVKVLAGQSVLERQVAPYGGFLFQNVVTPAA
jgi:hypothetical protein